MCFKWKLLLLRSYIDGQKVGIKDTDGEMDTDGAVDGENVGVKKQAVAAAVSEICPAGQLLHDEAPGESE